MKYSVITFGCRVNQADSLEFEERLMEAGAVPTTPDSADLVVVNTCSVTATSDQGARQTIRRVARDNPSARIVVTGCYATRRPDEVAGLPSVVRVVPNVDKAKLISLVGTTAARFADGDGACGERIEPGVAGRTAFTLRVQTGCAEECSYCIIPATRGTPLSRPVGELLVEIQRVVDSGFKEIALTGVHLGSYGRDLSPRSSLFDLLQRIRRPTTDDERRTTDDERRTLFRISSLEPMDCTPEIVDLVATSPSFAPHFHLPLQHASDRMLAAMRRPYTLDAYARLVDDIRSRIPSASIGSDVIVGFPGETDADFDTLVAYLERSPLTHLHVFPYSDRPGTAAAAMSNKIHGAVVRERARRVREIGAALTGRFRSAQIGTIQRGLTLEDGSLVVTGNYLKVHVPHGLPRNEWVNVRITSHHDGQLLSG